MPGIFSKSNRPLRPGAFFNWIAAQAAPVYHGAAGTVALAFHSDWGPANQVVRLGSYSDYQSVFGAGQRTPGDIAVEQCFRGEGLPGVSGADSVLAYRIVNTTNDSAPAASAAKATATLPAGLALTARYYGAYGDTLSAQVIANGQDPANNNDLVIYQNNVEVERFSAAKTDNVGLAAQVNAQSSWATAVGSTGTLTQNTIVAFTGGDSGVPAAVDYTNAFGALSLFRFSAFAFDDISQAVASVAAANVAWVQQSNQTGLRFEAVIGGPLNETATAAVARAVAVDTNSKPVLNEPNIVNLGVGSVQDDIWGVLSPSQLAPRVAGILARRGESKNLTFARLAGATIINGAAPSDVVKCIQNGVVVFSRDSREDAPTRIEKGVTSFYTRNDPGRPYRVYSVPKFMATMQAVELEITDYAEGEVVGNLPVTDNTRNYLKADAETRLKAREGLGIIQSGWSVSIDSIPSQSADDDFIGLVLGMSFGRSLEQIYYTVTVA